jgi:hypothetical protein
VPTRNSQGIHFLREVKYLTFARVAEEYQHPEAIWFSLLRGGFWSIPLIFFRRSDSGQKKVTSFQKSNVLDTS